MIYITCIFHLGMLDLTQHTNVSITPISRDDVKAILKDREFKTIIDDGQLTLVFSNMLDVDLRHTHIPRVVLTPDDTVIAGHYIRDPETYKIYGITWLKITISNAGSLAKALDFSEDSLITESTLGESILS